MSLRLNKTLKFVRNNLPLLLLFSGFHTLARLNAATSEFRVRALSFSPPVKTLISNFNNHPIPGFQASTLKLPCNTISNYYSSNLILSLWNIHNCFSKEYIGYLKELNKEFSTLKEELLTSGDEPGYDINAICKENTIDYDFIPNGAFIGKVIYGKEFDT